MAITHTITTVLSGASVGLSGSFGVTSDREQYFDVALDASAIDVEAILDFEEADLKSFFYICDKDTTLKTNSTGSADDTFTIPANKPFLWNAVMLIDNPFTADVTHIYITNAEAEAGTARFAVLSDGTP